MALQGLHPVARLMRVARYAAAAAGLVLLVLEYGMPLDPTTITSIHRFYEVIAALFVADSILQWAVAKDRREHLRDHQLELGLTLLLLLWLLAIYLLVPGGPVHAAGIPSLAAISVVTLQIYLVARLALGLSSIQVRLFNRRVRPGLMLVSSFVIVISLGTLLLWLPRATAEGHEPLSFVDALFTATSATCVTGLIVRDTGSDFSRTGQTIILALIQVGGLGLVVWTAFFFTLQQRSANLRHLRVLREILSLTVIGGLRRYLRFILATTIVFEAAGAAVLWELAGNLDMTSAERLRWSVFHSVSAFCNAGFALQPQSFMDHTGEGAMNAVLIALIVSGGIGFPVLLNILGFRLRNWSWFRRHRKTLSDRPPHKLTMQSRLALGMSAVLILAGGTCFWLLERDGVLLGRDTGEQVWASLFQSVTARTAGFNTLDIGACETATLMMLMILMAIGASPASTGGGIKTVTVATMLGTIRSMARNRARVEMFRRSIPPVYVHAAITIILLYGMEVLAFTTLLASLHPDIRLKNLMFEVVSALSTVGLSAGITPQLGDPARVALSVAMLAGRVGPLGVLLSIAARSGSSSFEYPEEEIVLS